MCPVSRPPSPGLQAQETAWERRATAHPQMPAPDPVQLSLPGYSAAGAMQVMLYKPTALIYWVHSSLCHRNPSS